MMDATALVLLARYNRWMNARLLRVGEVLDDATWYEDLGLFHGSLHRTFDHLIYADLAFLCRLTGDPGRAPRLGEALHATRTAQRRARVDLDERLVTWCATLTPEWLGQSSTWRSQVDGLERTRPRWAVLLHVFNHQTHHRGQVTAALSRLGVDYGTTDLPFMDGPRAPP